MIFHGSSLTSVSRKFFYEKESKMRNRVTGILAVLTLLLSAFVLAGCSKAVSQPSDEEIIKAIDDSGIMKRTDGSLTVVPPVIVAERGKQNKDGSWPVKITFTLTFKSKDGRNSPPTQTTTSFKVFRAKDNAGKKVWQAQLGS